MVTRDFFDDAEGPREGCCRAPFLVGCRAPFLVGRRYSCRRIFRPQREGRWSDLAAPVALKASDATGEALALAGILAPLTPLTNVAIRQASPGQKLVWRGHRCLRATHQKLTISHFVGI